MSPDAEALQTAAIQKIRFNALVLQMAVAEMLDVAGLPRRTFALQFATDGLPEVTLFHSRSMTMSSGQEEDRSEMVPHGIESTGLNGPAGIEFKHIVVVDGVHFTAEDHCTEDGDGSEGLGFFNARGLHSWPSHLGEVTACCLNSTQMDGGTFKGNFASDIGEALQVFGHSLDTSIARKGIAHMNQLLCVYEVKPHVELPTFDDVNSQGWLKLNHLALHEVKDHGGPRWDSTSSQKLCASPWIWSPDSVRMYGPVGTSQGEDNQEVLEEIPTSRNLKPEEELRAIALDADTLLDEFWTLSRAELSEMENDNEVRSEGKRHWFVLVDGEHITRVDNEVYHLVPDSSASILRQSIAMENAAQPPSCSVSGSQRRNHAAQAADPNSQQAADAQQQPEHDIFGDWNLNMVVMFMLLLHFMQYAMRQPCGC
ncbi:hypothetical protein BBO99_00002190 [Phytophthora kernoviae]|uniref:Uncharacterized protein n=2 Tax=Phytophthora kernoviae TaxID=325452 RepID=A0A3R7FZV9_9STRA|nr:hypothetical protein G195_002488 [Phytophthora kernoviae 00238/432]KAG2529848.1 hypothetical protein JM16_001803 [Phytophthora kernoviae]KAG2531197.1 hypothetical protein JM18_001790 [Phytophthora kernoviae]RLN10616.1 hypothetical protein BBI17_001890 [Phytophthora kernoviae]RLN83366.1 hypothetical protein BBO99_00002190 [Phytophthora kernoviae]